MPHHPPTLAISAAMRANVKRVLFAIAGFAALYTGLIIASLALLVGCALAAVMVVSLKVGFITLAVGFGLLALGVMFFAFLIKFVFARSKHDDPVRIEVTTVDHPQLFAMIEEVARMADAPRPKHVYLVPEVNASVSYDSTFWSMVLPVRKNLRIGLGLVNALTVSELRAVIAHEFGHFSQRSMKVGSYVYTVNSTIADLVQHRDKWDDTLQQWADTGGIFSFFAVPTFHLVQGVRKLLANAYGWINKAYLGLSRQMEFHADAIAAQVAGGPALISALTKIDYTAVVWENTLQVLGGHMGKGRIAMDIYGIQSAHVRVLRKLDDGVPEHGLFHDLDKERSTDDRRVRLTDDWDSHPALEDRARNVADMASDGPMDQRSAWILFSNSAALRARMSELLYANATGVPKDKEILSEADFAKHLAEDNARFELDRRYAGFYDERHPTVPHPDRLKEPGVDDVVQRTFSEENATRMRKYRAQELDRALLQALQEEGSLIEHFILDGQRMPRSEAAALHQRFEEEGRAHQQWLEDLDATGWAVHRAAAARASALDHFDADYLALHQASDRRAQLQSIVELGGTIHARLTSQQRFSEEQWAPIAQDGQRFEGRLAVFFRQPAVIALLEGAEHDVPRKAMERLARTEAGQVAFQVERFVDFLQISSTALSVANEQERERLKRLLAVQADRLFGA
ncbi:MAG TPA: M48 family metallopeptidase [Flavobacteriales bacterium]